MRDQPLALYQELILLGLAPENGMVLKYQALHLSTRLALEEQSSGESDDHAVVALASVDDLLRKRIVQTVANGVSIPKNL